MDPEQAYADLQSAFTSGDWIALRDNAEALLDWLERGGFLPSGMSGSSRPEEWLSDIRRFALQRIPVLS